MGGGGRPRGWFDDVPVIGGGDEPGSGDGSASSIDYFADVPTIGGTPDAGSPPSKPSAPVPTTLRDRAARALEPETTPIPPERQGEFDDWVTKHGITDLDAPDSHYDYRGAFMAGVEPVTDPHDHLPHWNDRFKQHGEPTFSDESQYSRGFDDGGHWRGDTYEPQPTDFSDVQAGSSSALAPDRAADEQLPAGVDYAKPYPKQIQDAATPGPEGEFVLGAAGEAAKLMTTAPLEMTRGAVSTVFGNPTAEELANPLVRASITNRMGTAGGDQLAVDQLQPAAPDQPGPLELAGEQAKGFVTYPFHGLKELVTNPDPYEKGKGAAAAVAGLLGLKEMAHGAFGGPGDVVPDAGMPPGGIERRSELRYKRTKPGGPIPGEPPVGEEPTVSEQEVAPPPTEPPIDATRPPPPPAGPPTVTPPPPPRTEPPQAEPAGPPGPRLPKFASEEEAIVDRIYRIQAQLKEQDFKGPGSEQLEAERQMLVNELRARKQGPFRPPAVPPEPPAEPPKESPIERSNREALERHDRQRVVGRLPVGHEIPAEEGDGSVWRKEDDGNWRRYFPDGELAETQTEHSDYLAALHERQQRAAEPPEPPAAGPPAPPAPRQLPPPPTVTDAARSLQRAREREAEGNNPPGEQMQGDELRRHQLQGSIGASEFSIRANELSLESGRQPYTNRPYTAKELAKIRAELAAHRANLSRYKEELAGLEPEKQAPQAEPEPPTPGPQTEPTQSHVDLIDQAKGALYRIRILSDEIKRGTNKRGRRLDDYEKQALIHQRGAYQNTYRRALERLEKIAPDAHEAFLREHEPHRFEPTTFRDEPPPPPKAKPKPPPKEQPAPPADSDVQAIVQWAQFRSHAERAVAEKDVATDEFKTAKIHLRQSEVQIKRLNKLLRDRYGEEKARELVGAEMQRNPDPYLQALVNKKKRPTEPPPVPGKKKPPPAEWSADPRIPADQRAQAETKVAEWWNHIAPAERWETLQKYGEGAPFSRRKAGRGDSANLGQFRQLAPPQRAAAFRAWIRDQRPDLNPDVPLPAAALYAKERAQVERALAEVRTAEASHVTTRDPKRIEKLRKVIDESGATVETVLDRIAARYGRDVADRTKRELEETIKSRLGNFQAKGPKDEQREAAAKREANRGARYAKAPTQELLDKHAELVERIARSQGGNGFARENGYGEVIASGHNRNARLEDDNRMVDAIQAELKNRGLTDDDLVAHHYEWLDRQAEREGIANEDKGEGITFDDERFDPDKLGSPARNGDLFGDEGLDTEPGQNSLFDERAGTEATRSTEQQLRALRSEREKLAKLVDGGRLKESPAANRRLAELDRILNSDRAISGDEMSTRARGEEHLDPTDPRGEDLHERGQGDLLSPGSAEQDVAQVDNWSRDPLEVGAIRLASGEVVPLEGSEMHGQAYNRRHGISGNDFDAYNRSHSVGGHVDGFLTRGGRFVERLRAYEEYGIGNAEDLARRPVSPTRFYRERGLATPAKPERVVAATVRDPETGRVYRGRNHAEAIDRAADAGASWSRLSDEWDRGTENIGFATDRREHISRAEAQEVAKQAGQLREPGGEDNIDLVHGDLDLGYPAAERGRPYTLEDLDTASDRDLARYQRYEENLAQRELLDRDAGGDPTAPAGQPSKTPDELLVLENELQAAERKLAETQSPRLKQILEAQVHNRTRQQEAYYREYLNAGREKELNETVRARFKDAKPGGARDQDERRKQRDDFERRMREEAERRREWRERQQREREQRDRSRGQERDDRNRERGQERQERERERHDRERERERGRRRTEPPPRPPKPPKPPPPPSMRANPNVPPPKGVGGRVRSLWRIGRQFAQALDARVYQGRGNFARRRALGFFELHSEAIRVVRGDWLDVIAHEVGHFVSKLHLGHPTNRGAYGRGAIPLTPEMMSELRTMGKNLYGSRKPAIGYPEEGIAEWARMYVTDPAEATKQAPKFNDFMVNTVFKDPAHNGPAIAKAFDAAREHYARYEHGTPAERIKAQIDTHPSRFRGGVQGLVRKAVTQWLDDLEEFRRFDESAGNMKNRQPARSGLSVYELARRARGAPARADGWLKYGMVDVRTGRIVGRSVVDALTKVGEKNLDDFRAYLVAKSAVERWENGVNPGIRLNDARDVVRDLEPRFKAQAEVIWDHYRQLLEARVHAGLLTPRAYQAILARNKTHVGFYRVFEDFEKPATSSRRGGGPGLRGGESLPGQKGSAREIIDPIESIMQDTYRTAAAIARHDALTALVKVANTVEGLGGVVARVPAPIDVTKIYAPSVLEQLRALGLVTIDPLTGEPRRLVKDDLLGEVLTAFSEREHPGRTELKDLVIPYRVGDKTSWYQIGDRKLYDAIEGLDPAELAGALRFLSAPVRTFRAGVTLTGRFIVKNLFRDAGTAFVRSRSARPVLPYEHFITGAFHWLKHDELVQRWRESGGDNATMLGLDRPTVSHNMMRLIRQNAGPKGVAFDILRHPVDAIRSLSSIGENVTRLGEYAIVERQALKKGLGPAEAQARAGFAARDVTQDFWQAGKSGRAINQIVAFFNAQLGSVANLVRDLRNRPQVVLPRLAVGITMPSIALYLMQRNDPEYKRIPRWQRDLGWIYLQRGSDRSAGWDGYGPGKVEHRWFLPKPFELGVLFGSGPERIAEWIVGHNPKDAWDQFDKSVDQALTPGFVPTLINVWHEWKSNHDDFRDRPIVPRGLEDVDARYQSRSTTGETARVLGDAFPGQGVSPAKLEHASDGLFGGLGSAALGVTDAGIRATRKALKLPPIRPEASILQPDPDEDPLTQAPGISGLVVRDPKEQAETIAKVYRDFDEAERHRKTWVQLLKQGRTAQARDYLAKYRPEILSVLTTEETGDQAGSLRQKYQAVGKLQEAGRQVPTARSRLLDALHSITEKGARR